MKTTFQLRLPTVLFLAWGVLAGPPAAHGQSFSSYPQGDDVTTSLGQFQLILDQRWVKVFDAIMANSPLGDVLATRHKKIYHKGTFLSPTLYDPVTRIGRSEAFLAGGPQETAGALAGQAPGRTYIRDSQLVVRPAWSETLAGTQEVHTFIKAMHLVDSFTTRLGFSVRAGMAAPTRPVCAGQVEAGSASSDFPANSFFNVYVEVDLPATIGLPPLQLVNVDPLLVQQTNIASFPPRVVYQHENSTAVSVYFNHDVTITDPTSGTNIFAPRGTLFGQLTLAGHGVGFSSTEIETFQAEIENELALAMPLNPAPSTSVVIQDFSPDYNAAPPGLSGGHFAGNGTFEFTIDQLTPNLTNYVQWSTNLASGAWQTLATIVPTTNRFTFVTPVLSNAPQLFYRWTAVP